MPSEAQKASCAKHQSELKRIGAWLNPNDPADARRLLTWQSLENKTAFIRQCLDRARDGK